jgi:hypothetical protein
MDKLINYETPELKELEFVNEGVLCSSDSLGGIDQLENGYDWSDMWK